MKGARVLVTGMGGELGSLVASRLEHADWTGDILGIDVSPPRRYLRRCRFQRVESERADVIGTLIDDFSPHVLVHVGVWEPHARLGTDDAKRCTEQMSRAVFDAAHRSTSLEAAVVRSGVEIYGKGTWSPTIAVESDVTAPNTVYGRMLEVVEAQATELRQARGVAVCTLRLAPVLGAHVPSPLGRLLRLPVVPYHGLGNPVFSVVEDQDAADAFLSAATRRTNGVVNIVANGAVSMLRAAGRGRRLPLPTYGPAWAVARSVAHLAGAPVPDHVANLLSHGCLAASNEAAHLLRFAPRHSTTEVIEHVYEWPAIERIPARSQVA